MAECGTKCAKEEELKYMNEKITNGETTTKDILKIVSDIKDGYSDTKFALLTIKNTQEIQANNDRDNKGLFMEEFKNIKINRAADKLIIENEKKEVSKAKISKDKEDRREKVLTRRAIYVAIVIAVANKIIELYMGG